jgi:hypothetical protein
LKLDRLEEIAEFELDAGDLRDASCDILVHWARDLKDYVDCLAIKFKGTIHRIFFEGEVSLRHDCLNVFVAEVERLDHREESQTVVCLERQILVV